MGRFVKDENIYVLAKIVEVDPIETTRYRVNTPLSNFYVNENIDTLRSNPAEVFTAEELYAIFIDVANMTSTDIQICFGTDYSTVEDVLKAGFTVTEIREKYKEWQYTNTVTVGDMVYYKTTPSTTAVICTVVSINEGSTPGTATDNTYVLYNDQTEKFIPNVSRTQINSAHARSYGVIDALKVLDEAAEEAREDIG